MNKKATSHHVGYLLKKTQQKLRNSMDKELKSVSLTTSQYACLSVINEFPRISNAEVARKCFVSAQTMILIVNKLEKQSLIKRKNSNTHGRIQEMELTAKGTELLKKANSIVFDVENEIFSELNPDEIEILCGLLSKVNK